MTLQTLAQPFTWPGHLGTGATGTIATAGFTVLDAAGEYRAIVMQARENMVISHVGWRPQAATGAPTADVRIETVATDGTPSGTLWAANTNLVTGTLTTAWRLDALTAAATINKGEWFAVKFVYNSGTSYQVSNLSNCGFMLGAPYLVTNTSGAAVKALITNQIVCLALGSSATAFYALPCMFPFQSVTNSTFTNTNGEARGARFQVPFKCRAIGLRAFRGTSLGDFNIMIQDDSNNELSSSSTLIDGDNSIASASHGLFLFDNAVELTPGTWYRAVVEAATATAVNWSLMTIPGADYSEASPGGDFFYSSVRTSGVWADTTTTMPLLELLIDQLDDAVGGAGGGISRARGFGGFA